MVPAARRGRGAHVVWGCKSKWMSLVLSWITTPSKAGSPPKPTPGVQSWGQSSVLPHGAGGSRWWPAPRRLNGARPALEVLLQQVLAAGGCFRDWGEGVWGYGLALQRGRSPSQPLTHPKREPDVEGARRRGVTSRCPLRWHRGPEEGGQEAELLLAPLPTPPCFVPPKKGYSPSGCELHRCTWPVLNPKSLFVQHHRRCWDSPAFIWGFSF